MKGGGFRVGTGTTNPPQTCWRHTSSQSRTSVTSKLLMLRNGCQASLAAEAILGKIKPPPSPRFIPGLASKSWSSGADQQSLGVDRSHQDTGPWGGCTDLGSRAHRIKCLSICLGVEGSQVSEGLYRLRATLALGRQGQPQSPPCDSGRQVTRPNTPGSQRIREENRFPIHQPVSLVTPMLPSSFRPLANCSVPSYPEIPHSRVLIGT